MDSESILSNKIFAVFDDNNSERSLPQLVSELLADQLERWGNLADGYEHLKATKERKIRCKGYSVNLRYNPLRAKSTMAAVDKGSVRDRPCFLCARNLPEEQKGILYRQTHLILCNPMPAFHSHMTIAAIDHRPQCMEGNIDLFLQLLTDFGSSWTILYNGPECGASAPDHQHFQAVPSGLLPVEKESAAERRFTGIVGNDGVRICSVNDIGRDLLVLEGEDRLLLRSAFEGVISVLRGNLRPEKEPMMSIAGVEDGKKQRIFLFPRAKHRPQVFFNEGDARIVVSPAVIEMCGVIITPKERDFERLEARDIEDIYGEVSRKIETSRFAL